jgi:hypothetical protein
VAERTSENGGVDWFYEGERELNFEKAREQLLWNLRNQLGVIEVRKEPYDNPEQHRGDGIAMAYINGGQVDHFIYYEDD